MRHQGVFQLADAAVGLAQLLLQHRQLGDAGARLSQLAGQRLQLLGAGVGLLQLRRHRIQLTVKQHVFFFFGVDLVQQLLDPLARRAVGQLTGELVDGSLTFVDDELGIGRLSQIVADLVAEVDSRKLGLFELIIVIQRAYNGSLAA